VEDPILESLRTALRANPDNPDVRIALVRCLLERHRAPDAETEARDGLRRSPQHRGLTTVLADAFYAQGKLNETLALLDSVCAADRADAATWLMVARCHLRLEQHPQARAAYRRALSLDPSTHDEQLHHFAPKPQPAKDDDTVRVHAHGDPEAELVPLAERSRVTFADVGGMEEVKEQIRMKVIHPLKNPALFAAYGKRAGGGILMYGPPGCGKTLMARATAGEVDAHFYAISIGDVLSKYLGESERNLASVFAAARARRPAVLFFDEIDALAASRRDLRESAGRNVVNQFLSELDGTESDNNDLLVVGATNAPWYLDSAFRRPGRFDRILFVPPPDLEARATILRLMLRGKPAGDADLESIAKKTDGFSGADLRHVVDRAVEDKLAEVMKSGKPEPITTRDLLKAAKRCKPTTREWFTQARNHATYANESGLYDDVLGYLGIKKR